MRTENASQRLRLVIRGAVQGVGFRPFVYRLATELKLNGWVNNSAQGVFIEVEGTREKLEEFLLRLEKEKPPHSFIQSLESSFLDAIGFTSFEIRHSEESGAKTALILPDLATCPDCFNDIFDPHNRRYRYPFTNCTNCGPRFSIIEGLPYDRPHTTMRHFPMCEACRAEYENPLDRRFHAQPNACSQCGPQLELWSHQGRVLALRHDALIQAANEIRNGKIVAVKGLGGFHLMVDARNDEAVQRLRHLKHREEKPFALMCPNIEAARELCEISPLEERLLLSSESPIVLLHQNSSIVNHQSSIAKSVAPDNPYLGVMLPYTPLHHLLLAELDFSVVATSGNLSDEPICIDEKEALIRLQDIADIFLVHNRPIARHVDDSIVSILLGRELVLRRARGYAPLPIPLKENAPSILAVGAHLKNAVALAVNNSAFISQHIGDLETEQSLVAFHRVIDDFEQLYEVQPESIACDLHPDYLSTRYAQQSGLPVHQVQHHFAHVLSCMTENEIDGTVLGVAWDGTGYGLDGTIWGGEFLRVHGGASFERFAHLRTFSLPGGDKAVREPRRVALGMLYEIFGDAVFDREDIPSIKAFAAAEKKMLRLMLERRINAPITSSVGRLFDAVASLADLRQQLRFEGQAAMELEFAATTLATDENYDFQIQPEHYFSTSALVVDWLPLVRDVINDVCEETPKNMMAAKFHNTLVEMIVAVARRAGDEKVVLSGGCFQNRYLTERAVRRLQTEGFRPYWHQRVPPNDGGIALGQIYAAHRQMS